ncbi:MAG TPA: alpha-L-fucosidase [Bryobacteraceae bacterium]|nr:alpha-L-fucosidase [Bryobacteraceae bacterium]
MTRRSFVSSALAVAASAAPNTLAPYGALPSERQLRWHRMEQYAFLHFTVNTFTDKEWGYGDEDPALFNPTQFDAGAIISALKAGGMTGAILTCKHHDGFCLWPTRTTEHCIRHSPWRQGRGDVVRDLSEAARAQGLKFGVYLSPWDRNSALYGGPRYVDMYRAQLRELLTGYGPIFEVWHDGANGGDGYYGGAREKRLIDKHTYYAWPRTWDLVRSLQPDAVIFSDVGPDIRWVGNERGIAGETCWATYDPVGENGGPAAPGDVRAEDSQTGTRNGHHWMPAECDVSIRPGWFWHAAENGRVKSPAELMDLYYESTGRGASFLLNVPPDRRGLLHDNDVASLRGFGDTLRATFAHEIPCTTTDSLDKSEVTFTFRQPAPMRVIRIREDIRLGQRVEAFAFDQWQDGAWKPLAEATSIGSCRLLRLPAPVTTTRARLRILKSPVRPAISEVGFYA